MLSFKVAQSPEVETDRREKKAEDISKKKKRMILYILIGFYM
jgi:hypothetical protein